MANICKVTYPRVQNCTNCKWSKYDADKSAMYVDHRFSCSAKPDEYGYVKWEAKYENVQCRSK